MRLSRPILAGTALVLILAACSNPDTSAAPEPSEATSTPAAPAGDTPDGTPEDAPEPAEPNEPADPEPADAATAVGDAECLHGTWVFTADEVESTFHEMMTNVPGSPIDSVSVAGDSTVTFDGTTMRQDYDPQQVLTIDAGSSGIDMQMEFTWTGHTLGQYVVEGDMFRVTSVDTSDFRVATRILIDGAERDGLGDLGLGDLVGEAGSSLPEGQVEFACSGDSLRLTAVAPEDDNFRFDYNLVRQ